MSTLNEETTFKPSESECSLDGVFGALAGSNSIRVAQKQVDRTRGPLPFLLFLCADNEALEVDGYSASQAPRLYVQSTR